MGGHDVIAPTSKHGKPQVPDPRLRLILFGGGHGADFQETERMFGEWVGTDANVLLLVAPGRHPQNVEWDVDRIATNLREAGVPRLTVWDESVVLAPGFTPDLSEYAGICFSAVLPHEIVPLLRSSGLDQALVEAAYEGLVIYTEYLLTPVLGPDMRYTAWKHYWIEAYGIDDYTGLNLTTDGEGRPTIYMGGLSPRSLHPQRVANETRARVCAIPSVGTVTIRDGEVVSTGKRTFRWYDPKPRRKGQKAVLKGSRYIGVSDDNSD